MKKNEGITMLVLVITVILLLILSGISINTGNNIIKRANLENLKTNMLLIEVKGKEYVENGNFNLGTSFDKLTDENEKNKRIELAKSKLKGTEITSVSDLNSNFGITQEQFQQEQTNLIFYYKLTKEDLELLEKTKNKNTIVVLNKNDLERKIELEKLKEYNLVSTNTNNLEGIDNLKEKIKEMFNFEQISTKDYNYLTNVRQISLAKNAYQKLIDVENALKENLPVDMIEIDLRDCFDILGEITGKTYSDEIIDNLFERFCVGK